MYNSKQRARGTRVDREESGALIVITGPFVFRIGYMVSRLLFALLVFLVAVLCLWLKQGLQQRHSAVPLGSAAGETETFTLADKETAAHTKTALAHTQVVV